jgi:hypothetical protein
VIPQGIGWQHLRALSLNSIPLGTRVHYANAIPFHEWRTRGAFTVTSCTRKAIVIETAGPEIGSSLLADVEHLLDHAAEQRAEFCSSLLVAAWGSPAWGVVTAYYWCFFSVMALTRLSGRSAVFLDKAALSDLRTLAGSGQQPGAGALYLEVGPYTTSTSRTVRLTPSGIQLHDAVWLAAYRLVSDVLAHADQNANPLEYGLWSSLKRTADQFGYDWCSKLRNAINYKPGFGYREVIKQTQIDLMRQLSRTTPASFGSITDSFEAAMCTIPRGVTPAQDVRSFCRLLGYYSIILSALIDGLHRDVIERLGGDNRWQVMRSRFLKERCSTAKGEIWPLVTVGM